MSDLFSPPQGWVDRRMAQAVRDWRAKADRAREAAKKAKP